MYTIIVVIKPFSQKGIYDGKMRAPEIVDIFLKLPLCSIGYNSWKFNIVILKIICFEFFILCTCLCLHLINDNRSFSVSEFRND